MTRRSDEHHFFLPDSCAGSLLSGTTWTVPARRAVARTLLVFFFSLECKRRLFFFQVPRLVLFFFFNTGCLSILLGRTAFKQNVSSSPPRKPLFSFPPFEPWVKQLSIEDVFFFSFLFPPVNPLLLSHGRTPLLFFLIQRAPLRQPEKAN